jgi:trimeric autotransporter adhesin
MKNRNMLLTTILAALSCFAIAPLAQAVVPAPDGGYPGFNTAEGQNALFSRTTGVWNTALGAFTLFGDTTGNGNTAVGINVLRNNVGGGFNTGAGLNALFKNTAQNNSAFGASALFSNTEGHDNTATGANALFYNSSGNFNSAHGSYALYTNMTGVYNTATGFSALSNNTGSSNTADGAYALVENFDGIQNTATGVQALDHNSGGNFNTAMGYQALVANDGGSANTAVGVGTLPHNTSGGANTALGYGAGVNVTTGSFNVYIGANIAGVTDEVGHTYISNINSTVQPPVNGSEYVTVRLSDGLLGHASSSQRYKDDVKPMDSASEVLYQLKPVTYRYKKNVDPTQSLDYGLVAEEVAKVDPELAIRNGKGQIESVRYNAINAMLLNEFLKEHRKLQEQAHEIQQQKATISELKNGMETVVARLREQDSRIQKVTAQIEMAKLARRTVGPIRRGGPAPKVVVNQP